MHNFPVYYVCTGNHFLHNWFFFHFPKKNNFMLVTPRTERNIFFHGGFPDCILCEYVIVM